jgi:glycosyltransferase involved in cell wall biosynthesis
VTKRKLLFVLPSLAGGGAERAAVQILNAVDEQRWDRSMYLFRREGPYLGEVSPGIRIDAGASDSRIGRWRELRNFIRAGRPDIVVSFLSYFSVLTAVRASGPASKDAKVVFNQQTPMSEFLADEDYPWRHTWHRRAFVIATRIGYRAADLIVTTSRGMADDLVSSFGVRRDRTRVVPNPVDLTGIATKAAEPIAPAHTALWQHPVVVAAGRLAEAKNYLLLVEAMALLRRRVAATLFILGQGDLEPRIRGLIAERGLEGAVHLCGFQANPWSYIARADVFVLTSRYEGFGNVLVEAMACGVPVVATASSGTRDIVTDEAGLLVEEHTPSAVADALERILTDENFRRQASQRARASAQKFALPVIGAAYDAVFGSLVQ